MLRLILALIAWLIANPGWSALATLILLSIVNGSLKYAHVPPPLVRARDVILPILGKLIDLASVATRTDSPGTWKPPFITWSQARGWALSLSQAPESPPMLGIRAPKPDIREVSRFEESLAALHPPAANIAHRANEITLDPDAPAPTDPALALAQVAPTDRPLPLSADGVGTVSALFLLLVCAVAGCASANLPPPRPPADPVACAAATIAAAAKIPAIVTAEIDACRPPVDGVKCSTATASSTAEIGALVLAEKQACSPAPAQPLAAARIALRTAKDLLDAHDRLTILRRAAHRDWQIVHDALLRHLLHAESARPAPAPAPADPQPAAPGPAPAPAPAKNILPGALSQRLRLPRPLGQRLRWPDRRPLRRASAGQG